MSSVIKDNPFYDNHVFKLPDDGMRRRLTKWERVSLWFKPTYTQCSDGYAWHYKFGRGGKIYLMDMESLEQEDGR